MRTIIFPLYTSNEMLQVSTFIFQHKWSWIIHFELLNKTDKWLVECGHLLFVYYNKKTTAYLLKLLQLPAWHWCKVVMFSGPALLENQCKYFTSKRTNFTWSWLGRKFSYIKIPTHSISNLYNNTVILLVIWSSFENTKHS